MGKLGKINMLESLFLGLIFFVYYGETLGKKEGRQGIPKNKF